MLRKFFRSLLALIFVSALLFLVQGCSKSSNPTSSPPPSGNSVSIVDNAFNPASLTVDSGVTVTWRNNGATTHTVTSDSAGLFNSGTIASGGTYSHAFNTKGTFGYHCTIHVGMAGSITVR